MQSTRWEILQLLQKKGKSTIRDLSDAMGLTPTGIRQHLALLQRDGLVDCSEVRGTVGRPHYVFTLTESGQALFPRNYDLLADWLLEEIRTTEGTEKLTRLLQRMGARLAEAHLPRLEGLAPQERVVALVQLLQQMGILAEWSEEAGTYRITVYTCPYHAIVSKHPEVCNMELEWTRRLTGASARITDCWLWGDECCAFLVEAGSSNGLA
ncbi:MAG: winged helix-turn-helix transcriptional regulator [Chloroflexi bacterium]|nr:winged helix-turn-helix transcriptional regulator [Chloroflexota bacterium]